ncbi:hypothetical protein SANA_09520 [Gottschalkiaceae bacterium SANA]|nr:hypothetical protein SANA_09520 [Gottschalkiaceae bacterium SANA]
MDHSVFTLNKHGQLAYQGGQEDWDLVHKIAENCSSFLMDDEDECVSDLDPSCYNCKYRRWTSTAFTCMK